MNELSGQVAGVPADFKELPEELIRYMYKEAGEDPTKVIKFISQIHQEIGNFEKKEEEESDHSVKTIQGNESDQN